MKYLFSGISFLIIFSILGFALCNTIYTRNNLLNTRDQELIQAHKDLGELQIAYNNLKLDRDNLNVLYTEERTHKKWDNLRNFDSIKELKAFLEVDDVSQSTYIEEIYDCENFAMDLQDCAALKGYRVSLQVNENQYETHMMNFAIIENPREQIIFIEPQNDKLIEGPYLDKEK